MSATARRRPLLFFAGFLMVSLVVAGLVSSFASPDPDGLDTVARDGCTAVATPDGEERLEGTCIATHESDHAMASSPLAGYSVVGGEGTTGVAGVAGVLVTVVVAGGVFLLLRRRDG
ncbi:PDGLE domain-containing protein [Pseudonocardia alni]|uniref:PDGLE domain-containing protein n=1 Tax=Pseudonocardia alni TaxID=33907 RepID=UPI00280B103E|nr:PDGLE domain-containing protein [Pseudonocardia alni]